MTAFNVQGFGIIDVHGRTGLFKCRPDSDCDTDSDSEDSELPVDIGHRRKDSNSRLPKIGWQALLFWSLSERSVLKFFRNRRLQQELFKIDLDADADLGEKENRSNDALFSRAVRFVGSQSDSSHSF